MSVASAMPMVQAAGPRCTFCGRTGHLRTWHDPAIRKFPCSRCGEKGHVAYNELVHPPARTLAQIRADAQVAERSDVQVPGGPAVVCGEFGHRADSERHRGEVAPPAATAALPSRPAPAPPPRRSFLPSRAPETPAAAVSPLPETPAPAAPHPWTDRTPAPRRARGECSRCGSTDHKANTPGAHREDEGEVVEPPAPAAPRARWTPTADDGGEGSVTLERARAKAGTGADGRQHAATLAATASWAERRSLSLAVLQEDDGDIPRPRTRGDCGQVLRPCPFVSCSQHLYLDVNPESGSIKLNFPHLEVWEMAETCSLDVADRGGITLEEVGAILNLTRERIRQVESKGIRKLRLRAPELAEPASRTASAAGQNGDAW